MSSSLSRLIALAVLLSVTGTPPTYSAVEFAEAQQEGPRVAEGYLDTDDGTRLFYQKVGDGRQHVIIPGGLFLCREVQLDPHQSWVEAPEVIFPAINLFLNGKWPERVEKVTAIDPDRQNRF